MGLQRVRHDWAPNTHTYTHTERCLVKVQTVPLHSFWRFHPIWQVLTLCCVSSLPCLQPPAFLLLSWYSELELHGDVQLPGHRLSLPTISTCLPCLERWAWHWNFSHFFQSLFSRVGRPLEELILCPSVGQETYSCSGLGTKKSVLDQTITQVHHSPVLGHLSFPICKKGSIVVLTFRKHWSQTVSSTMPDTSKSFISAMWVTIVTVFIIWSAKWYLFFLDVSVLMERMFSMRDKSVFLPTHTVHTAPLNFKENPHPSPPPGCYKYSRRNMGAAATAWEQLFDITPGWPRLRDGPVYSSQIISGMNRGEWRSGSTFTFVVV